MSIAEIGRTPRRDRSTSASRSVVTRVEIGPVPHRDRSYSVSRSVVLPVRGCGVSLHLRQGECFGRGGSRWGDSRDWRLYGSGFTVAGRLCWCSRVPRGWWVLHTRACSVLVGIAESCGTALSVTVMALLPCADPTSPHMGARPPHTTLTEKSRHSNNNQPPPRIDPALPCATPMTTTPITTHPPRPTPRSVRFRLEIGPIQPGQPDVEARTTSSRAKATCRTSEPSTNSRPAEARPISARVTTDLEPK